MSEPTKVNGAGYLEAMGVRRPAAGTTGDDGHAQRLASLAPPAMLSRMVARAGEVSAVLDRRQALAFEAPDAFRQTREADRAFAWACSVAPCGMGKGGALVLLGAPGTGKSVAAAVAMLMDAFIARYNHYESDPGHANAWTRPLWVSAATLGSWSFDNEGSAKREAAARHPRLLVLDDFGAEWHDAGGLVRSKLDAFLCERFQRVLPTAITSNLSTGELRERYGERIYDRLREWAQGWVVETGDESMRGRG